MASLIIYCKACGQGYGSVGDLPVNCPACGKRETKWSTSPPHSEVDGWKLTRDDLKFLKAAYINPT